jgi:acetyl esterase/lipase
MRGASRGAIRLGAAAATAALLAAALPAAAFWDFPRLVLADGSYALYVAPEGLGAPPAGDFPVVLGLHGMADRPDWECHVWSETAGTGFGFFVCPHGNLRAAPTVYEGVTRPGFPTATAWAGAKQVVARGLGALALLRARFGGAAHAGAAICVGFSQGAYFALHLALHRPDVCRAAVAVMPFYRADGIPRPPPGRRPPPLWLVTGTRDVGYRGLVGVRDRLRALGYPVELQVFEGLGHDWPRGFTTAVRPAFAWVLANL